MSAKVIQVRDKNKYLSQKKEKKIPVRRPGNEFNSTIIILTKT